jgi:hypothetical protein
MIKRAVIFLAMVLAVGLRAQQGRPDFSGQWKLDITRTQTPAELPGMEQTIEHKEPSLKWSTKISTQDGSAMLPPFLMGIADPEGNLITDGKEIIRTVGPFERRSRSEWQGQRLVTTWSVKTPQDPPHGKWIRSLSADGKTQTVDIEFQSEMMGTIQAHLVFSRR